MAEEDDDDDDCRGVAAMMRCEGGVKVDGGDGGGDGQYGWLSRRVKADVILFAGQTRMLAQV